MDIAELDQLALRCRTWGQWGPDDEVGALNYVDPQAIVRACRAVRHGKVFSLAIPFDRNGPQRNAPPVNRFNPIHVMLRTGTDILAAGNPPFSASTDDAVFMPLQSATQWDALAHNVYRGQSYNGRSCAMVTSAGAAKNSIDKAKDRFVGRGVLLDVARWKGVPYLEPGTRISASDLDACLASEKVTVQKGDFLLINTGHLAKYQGQGNWGTYIIDPWPGLDLSTPLWLKEKQVAGVAADTVGVEVYPPYVQGTVGGPWHALVISNVGISVGEIFYLKELAEDCAKDRQYDFLFVAPPLPITGAVGSPVNPMAIK